MHPLVPPLVAGAAGLAIGAVLVLAVPAAAPSTTHPTALAAASTPPTACEDDEETPSPAVDALAEELDRLTFAEGLLRGQLRLVGGLPIPWPEHIEPRWTEDAVRQRIEAHLAPGDELLDLDCDEFPCQAVYEVADDEAHRTEHLPAVAGEDFVANASGTYRRVRGSDDTRTIAVIAFHPADLETDVATRLERRASEAFARLRGPASAPEAP